MIKMVEFEKAITKSLLRIYWTGPGRIRYPDFINHPVIQL